MSFELRIIFSLVVFVVLGFAAYTLRPTQRSSVSFKHFKLGAEDPAYGSMYSRRGLPRKFAWLLPIAVGCMSLVVLWFAIP